MRTICAFLLFISANLAAQTEYPYRPLIAVLPLDENIEGGVAGGIAREDAAMIRLLVEETISAETRFTTVSYEESIKFLKEHNLTVAELKDVRNVGFMRGAGVDFFISLNLQEDKKNYYLTLYFYDTPKGYAYPSATAKFAKNARTVKRAVEKLTRDFIFSRKVYESFIDGILPRALPQYAVGDIGPAGGIIFFVKPYKTDNWQFLEAAPSDLATIVNWGNATETSWYPNGEGTEVYAGSGKANTAILVGASLIYDKHRRNAAELCRSYVHGAYNDWFLPSRDELNLLYQVLAKEGKGNFKGRSYWSSTQSSVNTAWFQRFEDGRIYHDGQKALQLSVRPIRMF